MPGFDGTGPMGEGPMTGGARGFCNPSRRPNAMPGFGGGRGFRAGYGPGYGRGFGRSGAYYPPSRRWYGPAYDAPYGSPYNLRPQEEVNILKSEADAIRGELDAINRRIEELEAESAET
ncbi:MAG: DUF5320 domain-containing protein [Desulfatiglans sp.]|nr:DUF5320 domain-containing protein [Thermodesulfobacteriota bacterium]MEE4352820.1 DUF5320 domain-containing protein [Desulfatiglans sp.]